MFLLSPDFKVSNPTNIVSSAFFGYLGVHGMFPDLVAICNNILVITEGRPDLFKVDSNTICVIIPHLVMQWFFILLYPCFNELGRTIKITICYFIICSLDKFSAIY